MKKVVNYVIYSVLYFFLFYFLLAYNKLLVNVFDVDLALLTYNFLMIPLIFIISYMKELDIFKWIAVIVSCFVISLLSVWQINIAIVCYGILLLLAVFFGRDKMNSNLFVFLMIISVLFTGISVVNNSYKYLLLFTYVPILSFEILTIQGCSITKIVQYFLGLLLILIVVYMIYKSLKGSGMPPQSIKPASITDDYYMFYVLVISTIKIRCFKEA